MKYAKALEAGSVSSFSLILSTARSESKVIRWLGRLFRNRAIEHRLDAELEFHVEQQTADYIAAGMTPIEARRGTLIGLGGSDLEEKMVPTRRTVFPV